MNIDKLILMHLTITKQSGAVFLYFDNLYSLILAAYIIHLFSYLFIIHVIISVKWYYGNYSPVFAMKIVQCTTLIKLCILIDRYVILHN